MGSFDTPVLLLIAAFVVGIAAIGWIWSRRSSASRSIDAPPPVETLAPETVAVSERVAPSDGAPAANLTPIGIPAANGPPDDLSLLKGVGPKLNTMLTGFGITRFDQIANWSAAEIAAVDAHLGTFQGRIARENWIEQAGYLARGEIAAFEAKFGKLDRPIG